MYPLRYKPEIIVIRSDIQSLPRYRVFRRDENQSATFTCDSIAELVKWLIINHYLIKFGRA